MVTFRKSLNYFFDSICDIYEEKNIQINFADKKEKFIKFKNIPCHLSFKSNYFNRKKDFIAKKQSGTLFLPWDCQISNKDFFKVRQNNQEYYLFVRGNIRHYISHIEVDFEMDNPNFNYEKVI